MGQHIVSKLPCIEIAEEEKSSSEQQQQQQNNLIRTTNFQVLNAEHHIGGNSAGEVWAANVESNDISRYWVEQHSKPNTTIDFFISHTWEDDGMSKGMPKPAVATWDDPKSLEEYGWRKSVAFQNIVRTIVEMKKGENGELSDRNELSFWLDKVW